MTNNINAKTLRLAVASNFLETAQLLSKAFEETSTHTIQISSGSSGKLYLQIKNGAPFDLFLSADSHKPSELIKNGFALASSQQTYALGKLTLWLKDCSSKNINSSKRVNSGPNHLIALSNDKIKKIAIANPKLAPYGFASKKLLERYSLWNEVSAKLIYPENIAQVAQFAKLGVVDGALIAESNAKRLGNNEGDSGKSCLVGVKTGDYPSIIQQLVITSKSQNKQLASEFIQFLASKRAKSLIKNMGYLLPTSAKIAPLQQVDQFGIRK